MTVDWMAPVKRGVKALLRIFLRDYEPYYIYQIDGLSKSGDAVRSQNLQFFEVSGADLESASDDIKKSSDYGGEEALGFALSKTGQVCCVAWYWYGGRYLTRNFWPLQSGEAKLVHIVTDPSGRGQGLAPLLLEQSTRAMFNNGFVRLYARIWHSNYPSIRAFEKAGWKRVAFIVTLHLRGRSKSLRFQFD